MTWWLLASILFWATAMAALGYVLWRTSARRTWSRVCPTFVDWVAACVNNPNPATVEVDELELAVTLITADVVPMRRPVQTGGQNTARRWA